MEHSFRIVCDRNDVRLDTYLSEKLSITRSKAKLLIDSGRVLVTGRIPKPSLTIRSGMEIEGRLAEQEPAAGLEAEDLPLDVLYEDEYLLAVNKQENMVVHPSAGHKRGTLVNAILSYIRAPGDFRTGDRPGIVHRLDKDTTGVILVAREPRVQEQLSRQFHDRKVEKIYRAVVEGVIERPEGAVEGNIGRHPKDRKRMTMVQKGGRHSLSRYKTVENLRGFSYVEVYPHTGRTHQIRVHLAYIGHPVVGDEVYGKRFRRAALRPLLHAFRLTFYHPVTGRPILIEAPVPEDMERFIEDHRC